MEPISLGAIIGAVNAVKSIAAFLEITQSEIGTLKQSEFNAAMRDLRAAMNSENERDSLLRDARRRFQKAIDFETDLRLAYTYIGLFICHRHLKDNKNAEDALREILNVEPPGWGKEFKADMRDQLTDAIRLKESIPGLPRMPKIVYYSIFPLDAIIDAGRTVMSPERKKLVDEMGPELKKTKEDAEAIKRMKEDVSRYLLTRRSSSGQNRRKP